MGQTFLPAGFIAAQTINFVGRQECLPHARLAIGARLCGGIPYDQIGRDFDRCRLVVVGNYALNAVQDKFCREATDFVRFLAHRGEGRLHGGSEVEVGESDN